MKHDRLKELVRYDPETGVFRWASSSSNRVKVGSECGCKTKAGYVVLRLDGKLYQASQLAWLYQFGSLPTTSVGYANGDRSDNRIANLVLTDNRLTQRKKRTSFKPKLQQEEWLCRFASVHGVTYDYSKTVIDGATKKVVITCRKHGDFLQTPTMHAGGKGCRKCANEKNGDRFRHPRESIVTRFKEVHGDLYDYTSVDCDRASSKVTITCRKHGPFDQYVFDHLRGCGCPTCYASGVRERAKKPWKDIHNDFLRMHGSKYQYDTESYTHAKGKLRIICPDHGAFMQLASDHANGCGCPMCNDLQNPKPNREIAAFIEDLGFAVEREAKVFGDRRAADVFVPEKKLLIEHNGAWWHSEKHRQDAKLHMETRLNDARGLGLNALFFFDDEWRNRKGQCKAMIRNALGLVSKLNARDCQFEILPGNDKEAVAFMDLHHIQGSSPCALYAALRHSGVIVMAASFGRLRSNRSNTDANKWELSRMTSSASVRGGASKIMTNLLKQREDISDITTYYDHRLFNQGKVYEVMGFSIAKKYGPDYMYVNWNRRYHKSQFQKANIQKRFGIDMTDMTEATAMNSLGYFRVWDCGKTRYEFKR